MLVTLASASPRRKTILSNIIHLDRISASDTDESQLLNEKPYDYSIRIAKAKNKALKKLHSDKEELIISSDTLVTIDSVILGKPENSSEAREILNLLSNNTHEVISSICLSHTKAAKISTLCMAEISRVQFKNLTPETIENYISIVNVYDKAGAYAVQENGEMIIDSIEGSLSNIVGFPLRLFFRMLSQMEILDHLF
jgi:septum formation protein